MFLILQKLTSWDIKPGRVSARVDGVRGPTLVNSGIGGNGRADSEIVFTAGPWHSVFDTRARDLYLIIGVWGEEPGHRCHTGGCTDCTGECDRIANNHIVIAAWNGDHWSAWKIKAIRKLGFTFFFYYYLCFSHTTEDRL